MRSAVWSIEFYSMRLSRSVKCRSLCSPYSWFLDVAAQERFLVFPLLLRMLKYQCFAAAAVLRYLESSTESQINQTVVHTGRCNLTS